MADYWKSNPKKYCELCKCWMADNKISIQNHENGMRHKASVAKKVNELTRSNKCAEMEKKNLEACLQQINDSAHLSMMKDLERDPSLAKQYGIVLAKSPYGQSNDESNKMEKPATNKSRSNLPNAANIWKESITPDGKHYYWNVATRATQWTRPNGIIEPEQRPPTEEKTRLKEFVLNRLVELSESGSTEANEAVLQAFNVPPSNIEPIIKKLPNNTSNEAPKCSDIVAPIQFQGPRVDLLGPWVPCDDMLTVV
ncbi:WW domain-binding protein isoform 4 [Schistosoma japonicum]|uniref:WW domain-binding protein isoform 4 n=1 Tax=Schistosoma japonicum TaxID=6182 RepID=A0A4Z2DGH7_SCHJA|nr:WW domain-binding protein isoform 4 [Schistosoma japonicum]